MVCNNDREVSIVLIDMKYMHFFGKFWYHFIGAGIPQKVPICKREPIHRWNPCFITNVEWWYSKEVEDTIRPEYSFYYQQNKFEKFHLH